MSFSTNNRDGSRTDRIEPSEFEVAVRTHLRTAVVELFGELDLATVPHVADAFDELALDPDGLDNVILDLRGLTFMDAAGLHELVRQSDSAHENQHNLAVVRGRASIRRLMAMSAVDARLVLVESPEDLAPPPEAREPDPRQPAHACSATQSPSAQT